MKKLGVVLAGGMGTRLGELTKVVNKHLLPVGPYPMIYHPIMKLVGLGIENIVIVTRTNCLFTFINLLGDGKKFGCSLSYRGQWGPKGIAHALGLVKDISKDRSCILLLGDNIFYEPLINFFDCYDSEVNAIITLHEVNNPSEYGIANLSTEGKVVSIEEKPISPTSKFAVTGLYSYPSDVFDVIDTLVPSKRGELEITDVNNHYIYENRLRHKFTNNYWVDAGSVESLVHANNVVMDDPPKYTV